MTRDHGLSAQCLVRFGIPCVIIFAIAFCSTGCSRSAGSKSNVVRIGYQKTGTLNLLRLRGTLESDLAKEGLQLEWIGFPAGPQLLEAMNAGAIDFGHTGDGPPILGQAAGVDFVYVACAAPRAQEEAIVVPANSPLRSVADLNGKRVALNKGSNVHYLLARVLESAQMPYDSVQTIFLSPSDARAAFEGGSIDAWAVWDPYFAEAELSAGARVLADGEGLVANRELHLASRRLLGERPQAIRTIIDALNREDRWAKDNTDKVAKIMAAEIGLSAEVLHRVLGRKAYGVQWIGDEILSEQQQVADTFLKLGLIPTAIDVRKAALPRSFSTSTVQSGQEIGQNSNNKQQVKL